MTARRCIRCYGFTLIEVLLSMLILTALMGLTIPVYESFSRRNDLELTVQDTAAAIRRGETYARGNKGDSQWGIAIETRSITLYKGSSFAARDSGFDETIALPGSVTVTGLAETNFAKATGMPSATGSLIFAGGTNENRTITVNTKGTVLY